MFAVTRRVVEDWHARVRPIQTGKMHELAGEEKRPAAGRRRCQTHITSQCNIVEAPPNDTQAMVTITLGSGQGWRRNLAPVAGPGELAS